MTRIVFSLVIGRSHYLLLYLFLIHSLILITLFSLLGLTYWSVLTMVIIFCSFIFYCYKNQWLKFNASEIKLERDTEGKWYFVTQGKEERALPLQLEHCLVTTFVVILYFRAKHCWQRKTVILIADAVDAELFRQLRVYCRHPKTFQEE